MIYTCKQCGRKFKDKPSAARVYCSKACRDAAQAKGPIVQCFRCGKDIRIHPSDKWERHFCGQECRLAWLSEHIKEEVNIPGHTAGHKARHLSELNRRRNPLLALEPDVTARGSYDTKKHRKMMEGILGRKLRPDEDVHHINGRHNDNRPENLAVMSHSEHLKLHWQLMKEKEVVNT